MGHDAVFVYMMKKYYLQEPQLWDENTIKLVKERVFYLEKLLIGSKIPDVKLTDLGKNRLYTLKMRIVRYYIFISRLRAL
jgi:hypothetical protein